MAYTIVKSDGTVLTTIAEGTINTTSTSLGLPGRNYAGYGQALDTNFVHQLENFAASAPPANPLRGQLWYNTNNSTLYVCPTDGENNQANWTALASTTSGGTTTFGSVTVTGNLTAGNISILGSYDGNSITVFDATVSNSASMSNAIITTANISVLTTSNITTGSPSTSGNLTGAWTVTGNVAGTTLTVTDGNVVATGFKSNLWFYGNGDPISFSGTYSNSNVASFLPTYNGNVLATRVQMTSITTGANTTPGNITGNWTLTAGSRWNATYADLAERFEADDVYDAGTVVEIGGEKEITAVQYELSEDVFGVISDTAGYIMNAGAGDDKTHPPVAVSGRVKVKVKGLVKKGQRLVSAGKGIARAAEKGEANAFNTIGRSLEHKTTSGLGIVEAIVIIR